MRLDEIFVDNNMLNRSNMQMFTRHSRKKRQTDDTYSKNQ